MIFSKIKKTLEICRRAIPALILAAYTTTDAGAMSRMGQVDVRMHDGVPCFSVSKDEELGHGLPLIHALSVYEFKAERAPVNIWNFYLVERKQMKVDGSSCLVYGQAPSEAIATSAPPLELWQIYSVSFAGRPENKSDPTSRYHRYFCLVLDEQGGRRVVHLNKTDLVPGQTTCRSRPSNAE